MRALAVRALAVVLVLVLAVPAAAQVDGQEKVEVRVTAVSGRSVYLDKGRGAGLSRGDLVTLRPPGRSPVQARIETVSRTSCRLLADDPLVLRPGIEGHGMVPRSRFEESEPAAPARKPVEHPPWTRPLGDQQDPDTPLLAPVRGRRPAERPRRLRGRVWLGASRSWQREPFDSRYFLGHAGSEWQLENPFRRGGEIDLRTDLSFRKSEPDGAEAEETTRLRLDRLSYRYGYSDDGPFRLQVGRFLQHVFPEFEVVDGFEADLRIARGLRVGVSGGLFPEPFVNRNTGDDVQATVFVDYALGEHKQFEVAAGFQASWHEGSPDRDLAVLKVFTRPSDWFSLSSSLWIDYYTSGDRIKDSGFQVSEYQLNSSLTFDQHNGAGVSVFYLRWPETERQAFDGLDPELVRDGKIFRATGTTWHQLSAHLRLDTTAFYWKDQDDNGAGGEVGLSLRDWLYEHGGVSLGAFRNQGSDSQGSGLRAGADWYRGGFSVNAYYEIMRQDFDEDPDFGSFGSDGDTLQAVSGTLQWVITPQTDLSLTLDHRFGDNQDGLTVGAFVQTRF